MKALIMILFSVVLSTVTLALPLSKIEKSAPGSEMVVQTAVELPAEVLLQSLQTVQTVQTSISREVVGELSFAHSVKETTADAIAPRLNSKESHRRSWRLNRVTRSNGYFLRSLYNIPTEHTDYRQLRC